LSLIFVSIATVGGIALWFAADYLAANWLQVSGLLLDDVVFSLKVMAVCVALRWLCGLHRGIVSGSEALVWLSGFSALTATARFVLVLPVMHWFGYTAPVFFSYQLGVAVLELALFHLKSARLLPVLTSNEPALGWSFTPVKAVLGFSLTVAGTATIWIVATQIDKLMLSSMLSLADYGVFMLIVSVASGVLVLAGPVGAAVMPRLSILYAQSQQTELLRVYRENTQFVSAVAGAVTITMMLCAWPLLYAWTGDLSIADQSATTLMWYSFGNGILALAGFPYYLQYAAGRLKLHVIGHLMLLVTLLPAMYVVVQHYGMEGAAYVWAAVNLSYLLFWCAIVHRTFLAVGHLSWLSRDILQVIAPATLLALTIAQFPVPQNRLACTFYLFGCAALILTTTIFSAPTLRRLMKQFLNRNSV
jgi:O-antigen/teichoic acid export membrane protein